MPRFLHLSVKRQAAGFVMVSLVVHHSLSKHKNLSRPPSALFCRDTGKSRLGFAGSLVDGYPG